MHDYLVFAGGLRLLEVSLPEEEDDLDLDLDDDPEYEDEPVVTDGDAAFGFTAGLAIVSTSPRFSPEFFQCIKQSQSTTAGK